MDYSGFEDVFSAIDELNKLKAESERIKAELSTKKEALAALIRSKQGVKHKDLIHIAWKLYWIHREWTKVCDISTMCDDDEEKVKAFHKAEISFKCSVCGCDMKASFPSRTAYNSKVKSIPSICDKCRDERIARAKPMNDKIAEEYRQQREALARERAQALEVLRTMPYEEYLQTEHWVDVRRKALKRANFKCQLCNSEENPNVHHRTYERRGQEENSDLIVLCRKCHRKFHGIEEQKDGR